jgi:hypothetical protein
MVIGDPIGAKLDVMGNNEYILLEGEVSGEGLRLPRTRTWYTNAEDRLLGTDTLTGLEVGEE